MLRDAQDFPPLFYCDFCQSEIYDEDACYLAGSYVLCQHCWQEGIEEAVRYPAARELLEYFKYIYGGYQ